MNLYDKSSWMVGCFERDSFLNGVWSFREIGIPVLCKDKEDADRRASHSDKVSAEKNGNVEWRPYYKSYFGRVYRGKGE